MQYHVSGCVINARPFFTMLHENNFVIIIILSFCHLESESWYSKVTVSHC